MHRFTRRHCFIYVTLVAASFTAHADDPEIIYFEPHTGYTEIVDLETSDILRDTGEPPHATVGDNTRAGNLTWNVTYADVTADNDYGFDDPALGATRRATLEAVLAYVNDVLNETTGAAIDIEVQLSQSDGSGFLATAGTLWFTAPNRYDNGIAYQHITTGVDPFIGTRDIGVTVDFGFTWNSDIGIPEFEEYDLFTTLLHEITHGLGFAALSESDGTSGISDSEPGGVFTELTDNLTRISDSFDLWNAAFDFVGVSADLISNNVGFNGTNSVAENGNTIPKIYAPSPWEPGSSISHWDTPTFPDEIMSHSIANGVQFLTYGALGIAFLKDIGYTNVAAVPIPIVYTNFSYDGTERGSDSAPVNTFAQAVALTEDSGSLLLDGSAADRESDWTGTIATAMTLDLGVGANPVTIGTAPADPIPASDETPEGFVTRD